MQWIKVLALIILLSAGSFRASAQETADDGASDIATETPTEASSTEGEKGPSAGDEDGNELKKTGVFDEEDEDPLTIYQRDRRELSTVEEEVNRLKERVFRSKATLQLLKELVVEGASAGSRLVIWHTNKMGGAYTMESAQYFLDGKNIFTKVDPGGTLDSVRELKIHEQTLPPGAHSLQVQFVLRGAGFGVFSYLRTYQFKVQSTYTVHVEDGKLTTLRVVANERGGLRHSFVDRPSVQYEERTEVMREE
jgi:hypothetical protein